jgi:PleD family two-component response regulator
MMPPARAAVGRKPYASGYKGETVRLMEAKPRALIAVQPAAWPLLKGLLEDVIELVPVHTMAEALGALERDPGKIDLIVASLTFSDSRMLEFLVTVKADPATSGIPFICCRAVVGILSENLVQSLGKAARYCGAADFVNIGRLPPGEARDVLRAAVMSILQGADRP